MASFDGFLDNSKRSYQLSLRGYSERTCQLCDDGAPFNMEML